MADEGRGVLTSDKGHFLVNPDLNQSKEVVLEFWSHFRTFSWSVPKWIGSPTGDVNRNKSRFCFTSHLLDTDFLFSYFKRSEVDLFFGQNFSSGETDPPAKGGADLVERPDAPGGGVGEEAAVQHHGPRHQVEAQEHGQGQDDLQLRLRQRHAGRALLEVRQQPHRVRVDGRHGQLQGDEGQAVGCHGDAPVLGPDVVDVELPQREGGSELDLEGAGTAFCGGGGGSHLHLAAVVRHDQPQQEEGGGGDDRLE